MCVAGRTRFCGGRPLASASSTQGFASQLQATSPEPAARCSSASQVLSPTLAFNCEPSSLVPFRTCRQTCFAICNEWCAGLQLPAWSPRAPCHALKVAACGRPAYPPPRLALLRALLPSSYPAPRHPGKRNMAYQLSASRLSFLVAPLACPMRLVSTTCSDSSSSRLH